MQDLSEGAPTGSIGATIVVGIILTLFLNGSPCRGEPDLE